jgi:predicted aspartyl protease
MKIKIEDGLPFVSVTVYQGRNSVTLGHALVDTGSAGSVFLTDKLRGAGIYPHAEAEIRRITGVGGIEFVVETAVDKVEVGGLTVENFVIESGAMQYQFALDAILGFDFLRATGAVIDLDKMELR